MIERLRTLGVPSPPWCLSGCCFVLRIQAGSAPAPRSGAPKGGLVPVVRQSARGPHGLISPGALAVRVRLALAALKVAGIFEHLTRGVVLPSRQERGWACRSAH